MSKNGNESEKILCKLYNRRSDTVIFSAFATGCIGISEQIKIMGGCAKGEHVLRSVLQAEHFFRLRNDRDLKRFLSFCQEGQPFLIGCQKPSIGRCARIFSLPDAENRTQDASSDTGVGITPGLRPVKQFRQGLTVAHGLPDPAAKPVLPVRQPQKGFLQDQGSRKFSRRAD